ncbi:MAG: hypothetical protein ACREIA_25705 [Opitutaceae bacterium]
MITLDQLRPGFLARSRREKFLTVLFLVVLAIIWASTFVTRVKAFSLEIGSEQSTANSQAQWLGDRESIEANYEAVIAQLSDAALPSRSEVLAQIDALVRKYQFTFRIEPPQSQVRDRLTFHTIALSIDGADYNRLQAFQNELSALLPTVNLEQITIVADRQPPFHLNTRLRLVAVEFNK